MSKDTPQTTAPERERDAALAELERAYQTLAVLGVPKERAKSVANGIDVLVSRLHRESLMLMEELAKAEQALRDGLLDKKLYDVNVQLNMEIDSAAQVNTMLRKDRDELAEALRDAVKTPAQLAVEPDEVTNDEAWRTFLRSLPAPVRQNIEEADERSQSFTRRAFDYAWSYWEECPEDAAPPAHDDAEDAARWPIDGGQALMCPDRSGAICGYPRECLERGCKRERK